MGSHGHTVNVTGPHSAPPSANSIVVRYLLGAAVMIVGELVALRFGVAAERRSLADIAQPLSAAPIPAGRRPGSTRAQGSSQPRLP